MVIVTYTLLSHEMPSQGIDLYTEGPLGRLIHCCILQPGRLGENNGRYTVMSSTANSGVSADPVGREGSVLIAANSAAGQVQECTFRGYLRVPLFCAPVRGCVLSNIRPDAGGTGGIAPLVHSNMLAALQLAAPAYNVCTALSAMQHEQVNSGLNPRCE